MTKPHHASNAYAYPLLIKHLLTASQMTSANQEIISSENMRYSYGTLRQRIGQLASGLESLGIKHGDTVAVMDWDCHRYLECFFAVPMMGAILHTVNIRLAPEQILYTINHAEDDAILVHEDFAPIIEQIKDRITRPCKLIYLQDQASNFLPEGFDIEYETLINQSDSEFEFKDFDESTVATTFYTTGTTGDPKGVFYSHRQLTLHTMGMVAALAPVADEIRMHKGDVYMPMTPMFHVHGWGMPYVATMLGVKQVYPGRYIPAKLVALIQQHKVTFSHCVPTIMHMLLDAPEAQSADFSGLKVIIGGSALSQGLSKIAVSKGIQVFTAYGMSETCPVVTVSNTMHIDHQSTAAEELAPRSKTGQPAPMIDLRVVDSKMNDVVRDGKSTGEVVIRTPWLTQGYTGNPEGSEALWKDGYMHTGDVGYIDDTGSLMITDRMKDVIKSGGEWLSSLELENIVSQCEGISEVAAIGIADPTWGERPMIIAVRAGDSKISDSDVKQAIAIEVEKGNLSKWAIPENVEFVEVIDKTSVGKLDKKVLRARYSQPTLT